MIFKTKFQQDLKYNNKKCVVLKVDNIKGFDYYTIQFEDGHIIKNVFKQELFEEV